RQLLDGLGRGHDRGPKVPAPEAGRAAEQALLISLLAGHPDRVARRRQGNDVLVLAEGGQVDLARESVVRSVEWVVVLDAQDPGKPGTAPRAHLVSAIKPDWLIELFPDEVQESRAVRWNQQLERVEATWRLTFGGLVLDESPDSSDEPQVMALIEELLRKE